MYRIILKINLKTIELKEKIYIKNHKVLSLEEHTQLQDNKIKELQGIMKKDSNKDKVQDDQESLEKDKQIKYLNAKIGILKKEIE